MICFAAIAALTFAACTSLLYVPDERDVSPGTTLADLKRGRELYVEKCGSCHTLVLPERYPAHEWEGNVGRMQARARLDTLEKRAILQYLSAAAASRQREAP